MSSKEMLDKLEALDRLAHERGRRQGRTDTLKAVRELLVEEHKPLDGYMTVDGKRSELEVIVEQAQNALKRHLLQALTKMEETS